MKEQHLVFEDRAAFREWLEQHHRTNTGIWLVFGKDKSVKTLSANEALEEALCFGWIDGQLQSLGAKKYIKRFTPRRKNSVWSERNKALAKTLEERGFMTAAGRAAIDRAREAGTWEQPKRERMAEGETEEHRCISRFCPFHGCCRQWQRFGSFIPI